MIRPPAKLSICGRRELENFQTEGVTHLLSLTDPDAIVAKPSWFGGKYHRVLFHDLEKTPDAVTSAATPPRPEHMREILNFGGDYFAETSESDRHLLVHCHAGAHRSTAAAFAILTQLWGPGYARDALKHVMEIRPEAYPNKLMVSQADELLGMQGEMLAVLQPLRQMFGRVVAMPGRRKVE